MNLRFSESIKPVVEELWSKGSLQLPDGVDHVEYFYDGFNDTVCVVACPTRMTGKWAYCYLHPAKLIDNHDTTTYISEIDKMVDRVVSMCWFDSPYPASLE